MARALLAALALKLVAAAAEVPENCQANECDDFEDAELMRVELIQKRQVMLSHAKAENYSQTALLNSILQELKLQQERQKPEMLVLDGEREDAAFLLKSSAPSLPSTSPPTPASSLVSPASGSSKSSVTEMQPPSRRSSLRKLRLASLLHSSSTATPDMAAPASSLLRPPPGLETLAPPFGLKMPTPPPGQFYHCAATARMDMWTLKMVLVY